MHESDLILFEEDISLLEKSLTSLIRESEANAAFLIDKNGQQITASGDFENIDTTALATLTAGNVAATDGLAKLLGERGFTILFHEGERDNIHISIVGNAAILVVIFDEKTSVGMVRLRVKQATTALEEALANAAKKSDKRDTAVREGRSKLADITDEDIDKLFN